MFLGRQAGVLGRLVALKGLGAEKQDELEAVAMLIDEARIASRVRHPNVVPIVDVVEEGSRIWLVMEHVHGETLARLLARTSDRALPVPPRIARAISCGVLRGLHAAHEATDTTGKPLGIVHRDVSPHNVIVSAHGVARVLDFGIAKAAGRLSITRHGQLKGKLAYMAPEQFGVDPVDRRVDIYAAAVLISELFEGRRLSEPKDVGDALARVASPENDTASVEGPMRDVLARGRSKNPNDRYATARDMADAIEASGELASEREVAEWLRSLVGAELDERRARWEQKGGVPVVAEHAAPASDATISAIAIAPLARDGGEEGAATEVDMVRQTRPASRRRPRAIIALGLTAICAVVVSWLAFRDGSPPPVARAGLPDVANVQPSAADAGRSAEPSTSTAASSGAPSGEPPVASLPKRPAPTSAKPAKPNRDCDPPYKLDQRGVKVLKLECLR